MTITASDLPFELIQEILTISAASSLKQAAMLSRISRHVHELIKPVLFRTLVCWDEEVTWPCEPDTEWLESNGKYVRNLLWGIDGRRADALFNYCPNLTNVAIWLEYRRPDLPSFLEPLSRLRLHRLSIDINHLFEGPFRQDHAQLPMFTNLTHLELAVSCDNWEAIEGIQYLPKLTCFSLPQSTSVCSIVQNALERCKHLEFLVLYSGRGPRRVEGEEVAVEVSLLPETQSIGDPRVVSFICAYVEEWEVGAQGGRDMWTLAQEIVERRTRKL
ncbi:hypothetical protein BDN72DRAFT_962650 [Pluteus cervinus]|uniref:Uncharacterized protein n=1 Tax=Pluteus cervinus TaxID=181527 RepID=A0ACD3AHZ3_9AGAR|nr:hypothetical protein BDN72DRAFT_962650 [Pluteus cervinus]